ncbi:MAG: M20/M25/M40 family metallo-hydrolase [Actinobacteria bacterium]|jgi:tripeptide aminopeptidase|nr:MAG: M20/M25/M40 family metallo-hydrolase [Actinomycetota bacterium]
MQDRILDTFLGLVRIDSETYHEAAVADFVMQAAREAGFESYMDNAGKAIGGEAGNVYIRMPGTGVDAPPLLLSSHLDTVSPGNGVEPVVKGERVLSGGETILGADCKAGVAAIMEIMRLSAEGVLQHGVIEIVLTVAEEAQLQGVRNLEWDRIAARHAFVLDGAGGVGEVINASPTQDNLEFIFKGKAAHAGVEPEKGTNAIYGASWAISLMHLGRIDSETTANIGVIEGGRAVNIVPDKAVVQGEVRSLDPKKLEDQRKSMLRAAMEAEVAVGVGVDVSVERVYDGYRIDPGDPLILLADEAGKAMGMRIEVVSSGGGSDANVMNACGIKSVVLGIGARQPHTTYEYIDVPELHKLVRFCSEIASASGRLRSDR